MSKNRQAENRQAEKLASRILARLDAALCITLRELKDDLEVLRAHFKNLGRSETIADCKTWAEFCKKKLHRTDRAVRKMLAGKEPTTSKQSQSVAEQSSAHFTLTHDQLKSRALDAIRAYVKASPNQTVASLLAELDLADDYLTGDPPADTMDEREEREGLNWPELSPREENAIARHARVPLPHPEVKRIYRRDDCDKRLPDLKAFVESRYVKGIADPQAALDTWRKDSHEIAHTMLIPRLRNNDRQREITVQIALQSKELNDADAGVQ